jgi:hypothetical protein
MVGWMVSYELEGIPIELLRETQNFRIDGVLDEIRTKHLPRTSLIPLHANLFRQDR